MFISRTLPLVIMTGMLALTGCQNVQQSVVDKQGNNKDVISMDIPDVMTIEKIHLASYEWHLVKATDGNNQGIKLLNDIKNQVSLTFGKSNGGYSVGFGVGCNIMAGDYILASNVMTVGMVMSTEMFCEDLHTAESALAKIMTGSSKLTYKMGTSPILTQVSGNGNTLVWQGTKTAAAKYGQQGKTVFWEIDSKQPVCPDGTTNKCLNVKPVYYNEKGIKAGEGKWEIFVGNIEGYTHDPKYNRVVRLKQFVTDPVDVKGKQFAYALDSVVEARLVK